MHYPRIFFALTLSSLLAIIASFSFAAETDRPARLDAAIVVLEATVAAVDHKTREITLRDPNGKTVTTTASEEVKNLDQVDVGDKVTVEFLEIVALEALSSKEVDMTTTTTAKETAPLGDKPAATVVKETRAITVIEAIDKESELVSLKWPDGSSITVKVRNPANLEKIAVGDKVLVTQITAVAISVTEQ